MSLATGFYAHASATLSIGDRIYPSKLPQGVILPALVYQLVPSEGPLVTHDGDTGSGVSRLQLDCWGETYDEADALAAEVRAEYSGFRGLWGDVYVGPCLLDSGFDDDDPVTGTYRRVLDAVVTHSGSADGS